MYPPDGEPVTKLFSYIDMVAVVIVYVPPELYIMAAQCQAG